MGLRPYHYPRGWPTRELPPVPLNDRTPATRIAVEQCIEATDLFMASHDKVAETDYMLPLPCERCHVTPGSILLGAPMHVLPYPACAKHWRDVDRPRLVALLAAFDKANYSPRKG